MPIGVIVNCISVLAGGVIGSALGQVLPNSLKEHLPTLFGMCSIAIGINSIIKAVSMTAVVLAILVGFTIGHLLHLGIGQAGFFIGWSKPCTSAGIILIWSFTSRRLRCSAALALAGTAR